MKFLVISKPRTGTGMTPTAEMIRAHKEVVLSAVKRGEADCAYAFLGWWWFQYSECQFSRRVEPEADGLAARPLL